MDWAYATTDATLVRPLFAESCAECKRFVAIFDDARSSGDYFIGARLTFNEVELISTDRLHPGSTVVDLTFAQQALTERNAEGRLVDHEPGRAQTIYRLWCSWTGAAWTIVDLKQVVKR